MAESVHPDMIIGKCNLTHIFLFFFFDFSGIILCLILFFDFPGNILWLNYYLL